MSSAEPRWVPRIVIEAVQLDQVREHGGLIGLRDDNALESALARARHRWSLEPAADIAELAADYAFGICRNHPFRDGNKRIAFLTAVIFLGLNGYRFDAPEPEVVAKMVTLAAGELTLEQTAAWVRSRIEAL